MADNYGNIVGQLNEVSWGGTNLGANAVVQIPDLFEMEPVIPDSMGGEPLTYLLKKKEIAIAVTFHETNLNVLGTAFGKFWAAGAGSVSDSYEAGFNAGADASWCKALVISPKGVGSGGRLTFDAPYAIPVLRNIEDLGSGKNIKVTIVFKLIRGAGSYTAKLTRSA